jgi:hypothetical protein
MGRLTNIRVRILCVRTLGSLLLVFTSNAAWGQITNNATDAGQNSTFEFGPFIGDILPNQISGMTEITGVGGARLGYRLSPLATFETFFVTGNGSGAQYKNLSESVRLDVPVESFVGFMFIGIDVTDYKGVGQTNKLFGGGHLGGGIMTQLGGSLWIRSDMKFTFNPGVAMCIDFGFIFRI